MSTKSPENIYDVLQNSLIEYDKLHGVNPSPKSKKYFFPFLRRHHIWTWWFVIMIPALVAIYFGAKDKVLQMNLFNMDKEFEKLNFSMAQEISTLKQKFETNQAKFAEDVHQLIHAYIYKYDADKTGMTDYALENSGASILGIRNTIEYKDSSKVETFWGIPIHLKTINPRTVIQRKSQSLNPGECWSFVGSHGYLTIKLSQRINVSAVSYEHLPKELAYGRNIQSTPKEFIVWSYQDADDSLTRFEIGKFIFDIDGKSLQIFNVDKIDPLGTPIVELELVSNYGDQKTCLYRFRVHGTPVA